MHRYFAKRPGGAAYEYTEDELIAAFDRGEVDGWVARRTDLPDWVPVEDIFTDPIPTARRAWDDDPPPVPRPIAAVADDLERLHDLLRSGAIDEEEYATLKRAVIARATAPDRKDLADDEPADDDRRDRRRLRLEPHRGPHILTLGVLSFVPFLCFLGLFAMSMGQHDLNRMREGFMDRSGEGQTRAGFILGVISSVLMLLGCLSGGFVFFAR